MADLQNFRRLTYYFFALKFLLGVGHSGKERWLSFWFSIRTGGKLFTFCLLKSKAEKCQRSKNKFQLLRKAQNHFHRVLDKKCRKDDFPDSKNSKQKYKKAFDIVPMGLSAIFPSWDSNPRPLANHLTTGVALFFWYRKGNHIIFYPRRQLLLDGKSTYIYGYT